MLHALKPSNVQRHIFDTQTIDTMHYLLGINSVIDNKHQLNNQRKSHRTTTNNELQNILHNTLFHVGKCRINVLVIYNINQIITTKLLYHKN